MSRIECDPQLFSVVKAAKLLLIDVGAASGLPKLMRAFECVDMYLKRQQVLKAGEQVTVRQRTKKTRMRLLSYYSMDQLSVTYVWHVYGDS